MRPHLLAGFFTLDPAAILAAQDRLADPDEPARARVVRSSELPFGPGHAREGLWSTQLFGPAEARDPDAWGVVLLPRPVLHPGLVATIGEVLGLSVSAVRAIAEMRAWLDPAGRVRTPPGHPGVDAPLATTLYDWPPYPRDERLERLEAAGQIAEYTTYLASLRAAQGIDPAALAGDDKSWEDEARANTGPEALAEALAARGGIELAGRLMVTRVPVPPVTERPLERRPGGVMVAGARSGGLLEVIDAARVFARLLELDAPGIVVAHHHRKLQTALQEALAAWGCGPAPEPDHAEARSQAGSGPWAVPLWPIPESHADLVRARGLAFVSEGRAVLDLAPISFEIDLRSGAVVRAWPSAGLSLMTCLEGHILYSSGHSWAFSCFDLARGAWHTGPLPACVPFVFEELQEVSFVIETATLRRHRLTAVGDYPVDLRLSPCARYLMARDKHDDGAVYRFDGELQFPLQLYRADAPVMWPEGQLRPPTEDEYDALVESAWDEAALNALVLCEARDIWRRVQDGGVVEGTTTLFKLPTRILAAAFDRAGDELLVADEQQLWHIGLGPEPRLRARFDLRPLHALLLGPAGRSRPRADALNAALCRFGSLPAVAGAPEVELAALNLASTFDAPRLLGKRRARTLAAHARKAAEVRVLPRLWPPA